MPDFGLYDALNNRDDFSQMNLNAQNNLIYAGMLNRQAAEKQAAEQKAQEGVNQYFQHYNDALQAAHPGDAKRIKDFITENKEPVIDALKNYQGNISEFLQNGGQTYLDNFKDAMENGKDGQGGNPIADALTNMNQYKQYVADLKSGLVPNVPTNMAQQVAELNSGKRRLLEYGGAYKPVPFDPKEITEQYGADRYTPSKASVQELDALMEARGVPTPQKLKIAKAYADAKNPGFTVLQHKYDAKPRPQYSLEDIDKHKYYLLHGNLNGYTSGAGGSVDPDADTYLNQVSDIAKGVGGYDITSVPVYVNGKEDHIQVKETHVWDGTALGDYVDHNGKKIPDELHGIVYAPDGTLWYRSTKTEAEAKKNKDSQNTLGEGVYKRIDDLHTQIGEKRLKSIDAANGGLKVKSAAKRISQSQYKDDWKGGHPNYSLYGYDNVNSTQPITSTPQPANTTPQTIKGF